jgi:2-C-methyl-D-erythritol 4-phosphate cytidylyltransferase
MLGLIVICPDEGAGLPSHALLDPLLGAPLLARGIAAALPADDGVTGVLVLPSELADRAKLDVVDRFGLDEIDRVVAGGPDRRSALRAGLDALPEDVDVVIVQEGARPLVPVGLVDRVVAAVRRTRAEGAPGAEPPAAAAAVPAVAPADAIVADAGGMLQPLPTRTVRALQGPAVWQRAALRAALADGADTSADVSADASADASAGRSELDVAARAGVAIALVDGDSDNRLLQDAADVSRAIEVFARRAADYVFVYPADLLPDDPLQKALDPAARTSEG